MTLNWKDKHGVLWQIEEMPDGTYHYRKYEEDEGEWKEGLPPGWSKTPEKEDDSE